MTAAITAVVIAGVTAVATLTTSVIARAEEKKANRKAARIEAVKGQRERSLALASNRVNAANLFAQANNAGVGGSSGVQGALSSLGTQQAATLGFANQIDQLNTQRQGYLNSANNVLQIGNIAQQVGGAVVGGLNAYQDGIIREAQKKYYSNASNSTPTVGS